MTKSDFIEVIVKPTHSDGQLITGQFGIQRHALIPLINVDFVIQIPGDGYELKLKDNIEQKHNFKIVSIVTKLEELFR